MKIGFFTDTYSPQINGVVTSIRSFVEAFEAMGHEVIVFAPKIGTDEVAEKNIIRFPSIKFYFQPEHRVVLPYIPKKKDVRDLDIIHVQTPFTLGYIGYLLARSLKIPVVHTYHTYFSKYLHYLPFPEPIGAPMVKRLSKAFCNRCDWVIVPSTEIEQTLKEYEVHKPISIIPSGVPSNPRTSSYSARKTLKLNRDARLLVTVSRIGQEKNIGFLCEMFKRVHPRHRDVELIVIGDGPDRSRLEKEYPNVRFTGYLPSEDVMAVLATATLFVFASKTETQGLVVVEALNVGLPVVALDAQGVREILGYHQGGILVNEDPTVFAAVVSDLLDNEQRHGELSVQAKQRALDYQPVLLARKQLTIYEQLIDQNARRSRMPLAKLGRLVDWVRGRR